MSTQSELPFPSLESEEERAESDSSTSERSERAAEDAAASAADQRQHLRFDKMFAVRVESLLFGRSPLALPRKAVGEIDHAGRFVVSGLLPGRYELSVRVGPRVLPIVSGPREVEVPIEPGVSVDLPDPVLVRPQAEE